MSHRHPQSGATGTARKKAATPSNSRFLAGHPRLRKVLKWTGLLALFGFLAGVVTFFIAYQMIDIPDPNAEYLAETTFVYYSDGKTPIGTFATQNRVNVTLSDVPDHVEDAVLAAEDRTFYDNSGLDFKGIIRAALNNASGETTQGASTITQQYVKVLYLTQEQTYTRKLKEAILALKVQRELSKAEILQGYLNTVYFGRGTYGIQAAAQAYFAVDAEQLSVAQGAALASILNSPENYDPADGRESRSSLKSRYDYVLDGMVTMGNLDAEQAEKLQGSLPAFPTIEEKQNFGGPKGFILKLVESELLDAGYAEEEIYGGGLQVTTTISLKDQKAAIEAVREEQPDGKYNGLHIALSAVEPGTGALRAMYGGGDYLSDKSGGQINWALEGAQPGSSFKPFAVIAALQQGFSLNDYFDGSAPYVAPDGTTIGNQGDAGGTSYGFISLQQAVQDSVNTAFIDLTTKLENGPDDIVSAAQQAGIPKAEFADWGEPNLVTALGYGTLPNVDMANGYASIAAQGEVADWYVIEKVANAEGEVVERHRTQAERGFSADIAADVAYAMQQVIISGTGVNAGIQCPAAGKTGTATSEDPQGNETVSSSWFAGYTPTLSAAVTYTRGDGNDQLSGYLPTFYGGEYPALTWQHFMSNALEGEECVPFPEPAFVDGSPETTAYSPPPSTTEPPPSTTTPPTTTPTTTEPPTTTPTTTEPPTTTPTTTKPTPTTVPTPTVTTTTEPPPEDDDPPGG